MIKTNLENRLYRFILWFIITLSLFAVAALLRCDLKTAIQMVAPFSIVLSVLIVLKWEKRVVLNRWSILAFVVTVVIVVAYYLLFYPL